MTPAKLAEIIAIAIDHFDLGQPIPPRIDPNNSSNVIITTDDGEFIVSVQQFSRIRVPENYK